MICKRTGEPYIYIYKSRVRSANSRPFTSKIPLKVTQKFTAFTTNAVYLYMNSLSFFLSFVTNAHDQTEHVSFFFMYTLLNMPRTAFAALGFIVSKISSAHSSIRFSFVITLPSLPPYQAFCCFPQLSSRIAHFPVP